MDDDRMGIFNFFAQHSFEIPIILFSLRLSFNNKKPHKFEKIPKFDFPFQTSYYV